MENLDFPPNANTLMVIILWVIDLWGANSKANILSFSANILFLGPHLFRSKTEPRLCQREERNPEGKFKDTANRQYFRVEASLCVCVCVSLSLSPSLSHSLTRSLTLSSLSCRFHIRAHT